MHPDDERMLGLDKNISLNDHMFLLLALFDIFLFKDFHGERFLSVLEVGERITFFLTRTTLA